MLANAQPLGLLDDLGRLCPGEVGRLAGMSTGREDPKGLAREFGRVVVEKMPGLAPPALHVHRAADDNGVVATEILDIAGREELNGDPLRA